MRNILPRPTSDFEKTLPTETAYADDVDFIGLEFADIAEVQKTLKKYNLLVKADKTEQTTLSRSCKEYKNAKKVGTLIVDEEDINRRKRLSTAALGKDAKHLDQRRQGQKENQDKTVQKKKN